MQINGWERLHSKWKKYNNKLKIAQKFTCSNSNSQIIPRKQFNKKNHILYSLALPTNFDFKQNLIFYLIVFEIRKHKEL